MRTQVSRVTGQAPWEADTATECSMQDVYYGVPLGSQVASQEGRVVKNPLANAGDTGGGEDTGSGRSPGGGHSSILAWRIPWTEEPAGLRSMN